MRPALELIDLQCVRGTRRVFAGVRASVPAGGLLFVKGENGSGKTSLLRMICGLSLPDRGEVHWQGRTIRQAREEFNAALTYLGHEPSLKDELSAIENLQAASGLTGRAASSQAIGAALGQAGLAASAHLPSRVLSQGQRKRAGLARLALSTASRLWVLDEPFNALDARACEWLHDMIAKQLSRGGVVVFTSHLKVDFDARFVQQNLDLGRMQSAEDLHRSAA